MKHRNETAAETIWKEWYGEQKRYYTLNHFLKQKFGQRVFKLSLDAGFTCPNRDGTKGRGGCSFCSAKGSGDFVPDSGLGITEQMRLGVELVRKKWPDGKYIAYFQAYSNTYAPVSVLRKRYEEALAFPDVVGLAIATRPDCLSEEVCALLAEYSRKTFLWVEVGLQSIHPRTMDALHLCYSYADFLQAAARLRAYGIPLCVHLILGLPGETAADMHQSVEAVSELRPFGIKLHMLHIVQGTRLGKQYEKQPFSLLTLEEYVSLAADLLEKLPPQTVIHRITGDGPKELTLAPRWTFHKLRVLSEIDRVLRERDSWQGKFFMRMDGK